MRFNMTPKQNGTPLPDHMSIVPVRLAYAHAWEDVDALVDSGSTINVLPHDVGMRLGLDWDGLPAARDFGGVLAGPSRATVLIARVGPFKPVPLAFFWTQASLPHVIFGHMNFFQEFDFCMYGSRREFEIAPKQ